MPPAMPANETRSADDLQALHDRIAALEADNIRLRAAIIQRDSALAFARQDSDTLKSASPDLPRRVELARKVETLAERVQSLMRERPSPTRAAARA